MFFPVTSGLARMLSLRLILSEGIGVYPYFAIGDWEHFCIIPVTEETVTEFGEKGVQIHEIS